MTATLGEATQTFARAGIDIMSEMEAPASPAALRVLGPPPFEMELTQLLSNHDLPTEIISHEPALFTHVGELAEVDQLPVAERVTLEPQEPLPSIEGKLFEGFWRPTELGFAAMSSLSAWGELAAHRVGITDEQAMARLQKATVAVRSLSLRNLHLPEREAQEPLDAEGARLVMRALRYEEAHALSIADEPRARTVEAAQNWIVSRVVL